MLFSILNAHTEHSQFIVLIIMTTLKLIPNKKTALKRFYFKMNADYFLNGKAYLTIRPST